MEDRRCKLGLQGRLELVRLIASRRPPPIGGGIAGRPPAMPGGCRLGACAPAHAAAVVPVGAEQRRGAAHPRRARQDQLRADAPGWPDRPPSLHLLEGTGAPRRLAAPALPAPDQPPLRVGRARRSGAHRRLLGAQVRSARHWATSDRSCRSRQVAKTVVIAIVDDHTRLAYCELHSAENAETSRRACVAARPGRASRAAAPSRRSSPTTPSAMPPARPSPTR